MTEKNPANPLILIIDLRKKCRSDHFLEMESILLSKLIEVTSGKNNLSGKELNPVVIYIWETAIPAIILGIGQQPSTELYIEEIKKSKIPVFKRRSGGGTVFHGPGNLCFSILFPTILNPKMQNIQPSFQYIGHVLVKTLRDQGIQAQFMPLSDIAVVDQKPGGLAVAGKISGNAQWRRKNYVLHHGTFLVDMDLSLVEKYLKEPEKRPLYREKRRHLEFITNLSRFGIDKYSLTRSLVSNFASFFDFKDLAVILSKELINEPGDKNAKFIQEWYWKSNPGNEFIDIKNIEKNIEKRELNWNLEI